MKKRKPTAKKIKIKKKPIMIEALFVIHAVIVVCFFVFLAKMPGLSREPSSHKWVQPSHFFK